MSESDPDSLPLEHLAWPAEPAQADPLRRALLGATCRVVRRRRRWRRIRLIAGWSAAYAAGLATAWFASSSQRPPTRPPSHLAVHQLAIESTAVEGVPVEGVPVEGVPVEGVPVRTIEPEPKATKPREEQSPQELLRQELSPEELRSRVFGAPRPEQIRLLRLAGDQYLYGRADVASALDCYRQVIELTPPTKLTERHADDSWLLAELKSSAARLAMDGD